MDNQYPDNSTGLQNLGVDAARNNDENMLRTVINLMRRNNNPEHLQTLLAFLEANNIGNTQAFAVNADEHVQNAGEIPRSNHDYDAYIMAGVGILVIGAIFWIHRETFFEFFATIGRTTAEAIAYSAERRIRTASPEDLQRVLEYFSKLPAA